LLILRHAADRCKCGTNPGACRAPAFTGMVGRITEPGRKAIAAMAARAMKSCDVRDGFGSTLQAMQVVFEF
jgi:hypothetical protein